MIGVRVTGGQNPLLPACSSSSPPSSPSPLSSLAQHIHFHNAAALSLFPVTWEKTSALEGLQTGVIQRSFISTTSAGAAGDYRGDPSSPTDSRWPACHCHLSAGNPCLCHAQLWMQPSLKNNATQNLINWCPGFEPPTR